MLSKNCFQFFSTVTVLPCCLVAAVGPWIWITDCIEFMEKGGGNEYLQDGEDEDGDMRMMRGGW